MATPTAAGNWDTSAVVNGTLGFGVTVTTLTLVSIKDRGADPVLTTDDISYTAITATVGSASFTGIPGLEATVSAASLLINQTTNTSDSNAVLDFFNKFLQLAKSHPGRRQFLKISFWLAGK